jgi:hypothetical protein
MEEYREVVHEGLPGWVVAAFVILAIVAIGGVGFGWYNYNGMLADQQATAAQLKTAQQESAQKIAALDKRIADGDAATSAIQTNLSTVAKRLRITALASDLKKAQEETAQVRTDDEQKITDLDGNVKTQLATKATTDDLNTTNGNVTAVKTDLDGTKNDLKMARSELGTLIARNHDEVDVLRRMGEREYVEFSVTGRNKPQKVGNFTVELRSVDPKKNKFTVALVVDDVRTEKKDRNVNEPIVFYPAGTHQADEFVVNTVAKDKITGYISMPKNPGLTSTVAASGN